MGALPGIFVKLEVSYYLLKRLLGVRTEGDKKAAKVQKLTRNEVLFQLVLNNLLLLSTYKIMDVLYLISPNIKGTNNQRVK